MKRLSCLVITESESEGITLSQYLQEISLFDITVCDNRENLFLLLKENQFDLFFISLSKSTEILFSLIISSNTSIPAIILSDNPMYAVEMFEYDNVIDFFLKPVEKKRLLKSLSRVLNKTISESHYIEKSYAFFKVNRSMVRFDFEQIDYIKAYGIYSKVFYNNKIILINESISILEKILPKRDFIRIHKSFIINTRKISGFSHKEISIDNTKVPIGRSFKPQLEGIMRLLGSNESMDFYEIQE